MIRKILCWLRLHKYVIKPDMYYCSAPDGDWAETKPVQNTESTIELVEKIEQLEKDKDILIQVLLRHKPELRGWVEKNFKELEK